jgi:hypothetical protein
VLVIFSLYCSVANPDPSIRIFLVESEFETTKQCHFDKPFCSEKQGFGFGSGSVLDTDSMTCVDLDPELESGAGSMGKKNEEKNALCLHFKNIFIAKRYGMK